MIRFTQLRARRIFPLLAAGLALALPRFAAAADTNAIADAERALAKLEAGAGGRLGVYAVNTADGARIEHRAGERFPFCSTFKFILAAAILDRSARTPDLLERHIFYSKTDLARYSPIAEKQLTNGMTVAEFCAAAIQYSDNTAANQLMKILGGPAAVTEFARSTGNREFRLDRWETALNSAIPGDPRDTATPASMARSLETLALGNGLPAARQRQLVEWLAGNTTGAKRIRAGVPAGWNVGDKTGSGDYGTANDVAVVWPPGQKPMVIAIYHTQTNAAAKWNDAVIAGAARVVADAFGTRR
jgi:beta-lactamase class A